ncbi:MAG TPA: GDSL-type esterase/lipase family protein, partial [Vicinamibacterales bacterium]|nr:GDSL-type esterase/lipase family protein [Vicinamibacterales bacterium]
VLIAGVNDVYQGRAVEHVTDQLSAMFARAKQAGIPMIAGTIVPYNTATAEQNRKMHEINRWIRDRAADDPNVSFVDTRAAVADPDNPDRLFESPDGLHPSPAGYQRMAQAIEPILQQLLK